MHLCVSEGSHFAFRDTLWVVCSLWASCWIRLIQLPPLWQQLGAGGNSLQTLVFCSLWVWLLASDKRGGCAGGGLEWLPHLSQLPGWVQPLPGRPQSLYSPRQASRPAAGSRPALVQAHSVATAGHPPRQQQWVVGGGGMLPSARAGESRANLHELETDPHTRSQIAAARHARWTDS